MQRISKDNVTITVTEPVKQRVIEYNIPELKVEKQRLQERIAEIDAILTEEIKLPAFVEVKPIEEPIEKPIEEPIEEVIEK